MDRFRRPLLALVAVGLAASAVIAQPQPPAGDAPPPPPGERGPGGGGGGGPRGPGGGPMRMLNEVLGTTLRPLPREQAKANDLKPGVGLVVGDVRAGSPAERAGLQSGDIVAQVGDQWAINLPQVATLLGMQEADKPFQIKVRRGSERVELPYTLDSATLEKMNAAMAAAPGMGGGGGGGGRPPRGEGGGGGGGNP